MTTKKNLKTSCIPYFSGTHSTLLVILLFVQSILIAQNDQPKTSSRKDYFWVPSRDTIIEGEKTKVGGYWIEMSGDSAKPAENATSTPNGDFAEGDFKGTLSSKVVRGQSPGFKRETQSELVRFCSNESVKVNSVIQAFANFNSAPDIYPGMLIQDKNIVDNSGNGLGQPVISKKGPITLFFRGQTFDNVENASIVIENPTLSKVETKYLSMIEHAKNGQGEFSYEIQEISTAVEMQLKMGYTSTNFPLSSIDVSSTIHNKKFQKHYLLKVSERYFTVEAELDPKSYIESNENVDAGLTYVKRITYGRTGLLLVSIDTTDVHVDISVKVKDQWGETSKALGGGFNASLEYFKNQKESSISIKGYIFGGEGIQAGIILDDLPSKVIDNFVAWNKATTGFSANNYGKPISYELYYVNDDQPVRVQSLLDINRKVCDEGDNVLSVKLLSIEAIKTFDSDGGLFGPDDTQVEIFGFAKVLVGTNANPISYFNSDEKYDEERHFRVPTGGKKVIGPAPGPVNEFLWKRNRPDYDKLNYLTNQTSQGRKLRKILFDDQKAVEFAISSNDPTTTVYFSIDLNEADSDTKDGPFDQFDCGDCEFKSYKFSKLRTALNPTNPTSARGRTLSQAKPSNASIPTPTYIPPPLPAGASKKNIPILSGIHEQVFLVDGNEIKFSFLVEVFKP